MAFVRHILHFTAIDWSPDLIKSVTKVQTKCKVLSIKTQARAESPWTDQVQVCREALSILKMPH